MGDSELAVAARARVVVGAAGESLAWLQQNGKAAEMAPVRRLARRARRLLAASERPTCVAVFGASQAGKSYLVSSLATSSGRKLAARFGDRDLDFLLDLNPLGGKESTGLVSRFTMRNVNGPAGAPVQLRLFSQTDVVKILANAALEDIKLADPPPEPEAVAALFDKLRAEARPEPSDGMTADDIEEMQEYFERELADVPVVTALKSSYWQLAADIIPRLPLARRPEAFAPLWRNIGLFTALAGRLLTALQELRFPEVAYCGLDALIPRETGVLNADTLFGLRQNSGKTVRIVADGGATARLDRAVLAALIAELTVPIAQKAWDFLDHTDLLDFPGARARQNIRDVAQFDEFPDLLGKLFLRGKVAYLFQRYNAEQEISAILLCVGPGPQEVQTLPEMINDWIKQTLGDEPVARGRQRNSLFLVLTKFDQEFDQKDGEDIASGERWTTRLKASLLDFLGTGHAWPANWSGMGQPFNNCYWLRGTSVKFPAAFDYTAGPPDQEVVAPRAEALLAPRLEAYLRNEMVRRHFADPARAWAEGIKANDGGISFLAERLRPICDASLKAEQIGGRLGEVSQALVTQLTGYYRSDDLQAERARARAQAEQLVRGLVGCAQAQTFAILLRALQIMHDDMMAVFWRLQSEPADEAEPAGGAPAALDDWGDLGAAIAAPSSAPDRFDRLANAAVHEWIVKIKALAESAEVTTYYRLSNDHARTLEAALSQGATRHALRRDLAAVLRKEGSFVQRNAAVAQKLAMIMEQSINRYVCWLGFERLAPDKRPRTANGARTIFAPRAPFTGMPPLSDQATAYERTFQVDWMTAVAKTIELNIDDITLSGIDVAQNDRLGAILSQLNAA